MSGGGAAPALPARRSVVPTSIVEHTGELPPALP
jgi:hypothetical protein